mmetsp:Transcript_20411/g.30253  ORF Transcript_20411/g.30253 Transcript_20411/m.30253 type:complete len:132 (+) Transcript_20411:178-573(+)
MESLEHGFITNDASSKNSRKESAATLQKKESERWKAWALSGTLVIESRSRENAARRRPRRKRRSRRRKVRARQAAFLIQNTDRRSANVRPQAGKLQEGRDPESRILWGTGASYIYIYVMRDDPFDQMILSR